MRERRSKIAKLDPHLIIDILNLHLQMPKVLALPECAEIPDDAVVTSITADWFQRVILAEISHPSFEPVPDGEEPPRIPGLTESWRTIELPTKETQDK